MVESKTMTLRELRERLLALTDAQLDAPARWWGDERGGEVVRVDVLEEEFADFGNGGLEPISSYRDDPDYDEIVAGATHRRPAGTVFLAVD